MIRISERTAAEIEGYRFFEGQTDCREICDARPRLNIAERNTQRLPVSKKIKKIKILLLTTVQQIFSLTCNNYKFFFFNTKL